MSVTRRARAGLRFGLAAAAMIAVLIGGIQPAGACLNDSDTRSMRLRYMSSYQQRNSVSPTTERLSVMRASRADGRVPYLAEAREEEKRYTIGTVVRTLSEWRLNVRGWVWELGGLGGGVVLLFWAAAIARRRRRRALEAAGCAETVADGRDLLGADPRVWSTAVAAGAVAMALFAADFLATSGRLWTDDLVARPVTSVPAPHHFPDVANREDPHEPLRPRMTLRFGMVHDVLYEQYLRPGEDYYEARNREVREKLEGFDGEPDGRWYGWKDDLAVGLERLGKFDEAEEVLRSKLEAQRRDGLYGAALYSSYANLGTVLLHSTLGPAVEGHRGALKRAREGLGFVEKAIEVNPDAHFGRETWQAVGAQFLLEASPSFELLERYDMLGQPLDADRSYLALQGGIRRLMGYPLLASSQPLVANHEFGARETRPRKAIPKVGGAPEWREAMEVESRGPVPFDSPVLGIIGMWRMGGGPNPHFALALGGVMERVGRPRLAWAAYERAVRMKGEWPEQVRQTLVDYSRARQQRLAEHLGRSAEQMRRRFERKLERGRILQSKYEVFETGWARRVDSVLEGDPVGAYYDLFPREATLLEGRERVQVRGWLDPDLWMMVLAWPFVVLVAGMAAVGRAWSVNVDFKAPYQQ